MQGIVGAWHLVGAWHFILREENRLRAFEERALRRIFGPKREDTTGDWTKLQKK
jgi:hypothetical protein